MSTEVLLGRVEVPLTVGWFVSGAAKFAGRPLFSVGYW
jgi:hypothetical protein